MRLIACLTAVAIATPVVLSAQGLAAVAKKEEARRKAVTTGGKVYTNDNLRPDITPAGSPASPNGSPAVPSAPAAPAPSANPAAGDAAAGEVKDEAYWRNRMSGARSAVERSRIFADALQSRINALTTDIVNRADPAQRAQLELERQRAVAELDRVKKEIADGTKAIADLEEEARKAGVPPGWLR